MTLTDRSARAARRPRGRPAATALLLGSLAGLLLAAAPGAAEAAAPNGRGTGGVDVDLGVLDSLPPSPPATKRPPPARKPPAARKAAPEAAAPPAPAPAPPAPPTPALATPAPPVPPPPTFAAPPAAEPVPAAPATSPTTSAAALTAPAPPPPSTLRRGGEQVGRIAFAGDSTTLPPEAKATLDELVQRMQSDERLHLMLNGYAANAGDNSLTRRTSLARALAVRAYLVDRGIPPMRIDVRSAVSSSSSGGDAPPDRVDLMASERLPANAPAPSPSRREDSSR
jgi:outer membrane protein OmpA-like peptidoglycan-associated protein